MEMIAIISSVVAAIVAIAALVFSIRNSKASLQNRIARKEAKIRRIENQQFQLYKPHDRPNVITPLDEKKARLQSEIDDLKRKI